MTKLRINMRYLSGSLLLAALVSGCASQAPQRAGGEVGASSSAPAAPAAASGERYAMTGDAYPVAPPDVTTVPDAEPRLEQIGRLPELQDAVVAPAAAPVLEVHHRTLW